MIFDGTVLSCRLKSLTETFLLHLFLLFQSLSGKMLQR